MNRKSVLLLLPQINFNEKEFLTIKKKLQNRSINLFIASLKKEACRGEKNLIVFPDVDLFNIKSSNFEALVMIGGKGCYELAENESILRIVKNFFEKKKIIGAICGAPFILAKAGILTDKKIACHPSIKNYLNNFSAIVLPLDIVKDENIITAKDENCSEAFADTILEELKTY